MRITAPITATNKLQIHDASPNPDLPNASKSQPPRTAPKIPRIRFLKKPPSSFIIAFAIIPASAPMTIQPIQDI
jgi:hypothetical protein